MKKLRHIVFSLVALASLIASAAGQENPFEQGDHVAYIGNTLADRMQHHGWLETYIHALLPEHDLTFRNLGFSGDEVKLRQRADNFGNADQWLTKVEADVVFCFFGYNEALKGESYFPQFKKDLTEMLDHMKSQQYNGQSPPTLIVFSPIAHEDIESQHLPDGSQNNKNLALYTEAMRGICEEKDVTFVDLFSISKQLYEQSIDPLTMNGIHLLDHGNKALAQAIIKHFAADTEIPSDESIANLRQAVLDKNYHWFSRYRVVDEYNVFGGRSKLAWFGQSNADVMMREMEIFDVKTANRDKRVWAMAKGSDLEIKDDNLPPEQVVRPNKQGPLEGGAFPYIDGETAIDKMKVDEELEVNLFASEAQFPRLINPVQMAVDTDSRLWASVWPSYPHWNPTEPRKDALVILPDEDGDGKADELIVFADELNSITGFEFWGGGVLVAAPPEIWFLKDTDGDDKADFKLRMLQGVSSADTHHSANAMLVGPDGWLYWSRGIFNVAAFETPTKTYRSGKSGVHRFNPRTFEVEFHYPIGPNPHGDVFDKWGFQFANDGTSGTGGYVSIGKGLRPGGKQWFKKEWRPVAATGILSSTHFPPEYQNDFLICNTIGFLGVLRYDVTYNGAEITAIRTTDLVRSSDDNFRPSDLEVGGDGAIYVSDWHNALIGHMQHNMRDPNRDHEHGRIYRFTAKDRELLDPVRMKGKPIAEVLGHFFSKENGVRYRARLELSGRSTADVIDEVTRFTASLDPANASPERDEAQALLECLWVHEEHRVPDMDLVHKTFQAEEPRVRAAAIRTLGHWAGKVQDWQPLIAEAARDGSALVRAESVKAAVEFGGDDMAEIIYIAATRDLDPELNNVLDYARKHIPADRLLADAIKSSRPLSTDARAYALQRATPQLLLQMETSADVYQSLLARGDIAAQYRWQAVTALANGKGSSAIQQLVDSIMLAEKQSHESIADLADMLATADANDLADSIAPLEGLALQGATPNARTAAFAAWYRSGDIQHAFDHAKASAKSLRDGLASIARIEDQQTLTELYPLVRPLMFELPQSAQDDELRKQALAVVSAWRGHLDDKVSDFTKLVEDVSLSAGALAALADLPSDKVADHLSRDHAARLLEILFRQADQATPVQRQSNEFSNLLRLGASLTDKGATEPVTATRKLAALRDSIPVRANRRVMQLGRQVYHRESHCATCHQPNGQGLPNLYPPLDGSLWVTGSEDRLINLALDGMHGTIEVNGKRYSSPPLPPMTGFRHLLNDRELAAVLTYVRNSWNNRANPINRNQVARIRNMDRREDAAFWYANDLLAKYPLEDGSGVVAESSAGDWTPKFVKEWNATDFDDVASELKSRTFENGKLAFERLGCAQCHKLGDVGGVFGPNLAELEDKKRDPAYILQSIIEPAKDVEEEFAVQTYLLDTGKTVSGLVVKETDEQIHVVTDPLKQDMPTVINKDEIEEQFEAQSSIMPQGLLNWLQKEDILDLVAYVLAAGDKNHPAFNK